MNRKDQGQATRARLIQAMTDLARAKGFHATRVEDVCDRAGVTKGSFFHHFASRDDLALSAAQTWRDNLPPFFGAAPYHQEPTAVGRVLGYVAFRKALLAGPVEGFCCYAGTVVSECWAGESPVLDTARGAIDDHIAEVAALASAALAETGQPPDRAQALSTLIQATVQGALILAKSAGSPAPAIAAFDQLHALLRTQFQSQALS